MFCLIVGIMTASTTGQGVRGSLDPNILVISGHVFLMPIGRIVLVRKDTQYGAIKFTEEWEGETDNDNFTKYESYYQGDGSGDFSKGNVQFNKALLSERKYIPYIPIFPRLGGYPAGPENTQIKCGPIKLAWSGWGNVYFNERTWKFGDHGIELAPTKWTDITQVNVFDPRVKWYRYDEKRKKTFIPIDEIWKDGENQK
jgi:hypothetical protein